MGTIFYHSSAPLPKVDKVDFPDTVEMFERVDVEVKSSNFLSKSQKTHDSSKISFQTCISHLAHNKCNNFCENDKIHFEIGRI